jgi:hypothetical protein
VPTYEFKCEGCGAGHEFYYPHPDRAPGIGEYSAWACTVSEENDQMCLGRLIRVCSIPHVPPDSLSVDPDNVPIQHRVASNDGFGIGEKAARKREKAYEESMQVKRAMARDRSLSKGNMKMTHSIPPELYHGKIKETGDKEYWTDPKNRNRHSSTKVT